MSDPFVEIGFGQGDKEIRESTTRDDLKFRKDDLMRLSLALWNVVEKDGRMVFDMDAKTPRFIKAPVNYIKGAGYIVNQGPEYTRLAGEEPKDRIATVVVSWPIQSDGQTDVDLLKLGRWKVYPWVITPVKYTDLVRQNTIRHLGKHDLQVHCTNADFQHLKFQHYENNYLRGFMETKPEIFERLLSDIQRAEKKLKNLIGRMMTIDQLREKLGQDSAPGTTSSGHSPVTQPAITAADAVNFDDMIGNIVNS